MKSVKKWVFKLFLLLLFSIYGCAHTDHKEELPKVNISPGVASIRGDVAKAEPVFKPISPLDTKKVSLSVVHEDFHNILFYLAREAGLSLVIDREVENVVIPEQRYVTAEFQNFTVRQLLDSLTEALGISYSVKEGVIYIEPFKEKIFNLGFILTIRGSKFKVGGDVLGGTSQQTSGSTTSYISNPLSGLFELEGETTKSVNDIYDLIDKSMKDGKLLSERGSYSLDRFTGTLMVRDYPKHVDRIEKLIENLKSRYESQVTIDARIIEVELSKSHEFGVQWQTVLNEEIGKRPDVGSVTNFFYGTGDEAKALVAHLTVAPYFDAIIRTIETYGKVNVISNPKIRVLHGQPALMSVGTSIAYVKSIKREVTTTGSSESKETTVEPSAVFDGLIFGVVPYVQPNEEILLQIIPIKSDVVRLDEKTIDNNTITLPTVNLRESSTVVKVRPGDIVIIGGIILDKKKETHSRVPFIGSIPGIGMLFGQKTKEFKKVEMIILLEAKLMK